MVGISQSPSTLRELVSQVRQSDVRALQKAPLGALANLERTADRTAFAGADAATIDRVLGDVLPPYAPVPAPSAAWPVAEAIAGSGYAHPRGPAGPGYLDLGPGDGRDALARIADPKLAKVYRMERLFNLDPRAQVAFESVVRGHVSPDGRADGRVSLTPFAEGPGPDASSEMARVLIGHLDSMERAMASMNERMGQGRDKDVDWSDEDESWSREGSPGRTYSSFMSSGFSQLGSQLAVGRAVTVVTRAVGAGPSAAGRTIEELLMMMDGAVARQAAQVNAAQQQANASGNTSAMTGGSLSLGGLVGATTGATAASPATANIRALTNTPGGATSVGTSSSSVDIEVKKLEEMMHKRTQMFDTLRGILDKSNETAKNILNALK